METRIANDAGKRKDFKISIQILNPKGEIVAEKESKVNLNVAETSVCNWRFCVDGYELFR